jgi:IS30 family transposase
LFKNIVLYLSYAMNKTTQDDLKVNYNHLSFEQRVMIKTLRDEWNTQQYIADRVWCSQWSVSRELSRNLITNGHWREVYKPKDAQQIYEMRRNKANFSHNLYVQHKRLLWFIQDELPKHSPDVIAQRLLKQEKWIPISTATIYNIIAMIKPELRKKLTFKHWYKKNKGAKKSRICPDLPRIQMRSEIANNRQEQWHWEADSIVSCSHIWWVTTLSERYSRYMLIKRSLRLDATTALFNMLDMLAWHDVRSITSDNGSEFAFLDTLVKKLDCLWYLCDPYCSWQKW